MPRPPIRLAKNDQHLVLDGVIASFAKDAIRLIALAVEAVHLHALICCPDHDPRKWLGRAKGRVARKLLDADRASGRVWGKRCGITSIVDRAHQVATYRYILRHADKNTLTWRYKLTG